MTKLRYFSVPGLLIASTLAVAACSSASGGQSATDASTASPASASTAAASPVQTSPSAAASPTASASGSSGHSGFDAALAEWKQGASASLATMGTYFLQAASDLKGTGDASYDTAVSQLTYLAHVPDSNATPTQQATAESDAKALDKFFGTPGLNS
jgi:hypothetical protein